MSINPIATTKSIEANYRNYLTTTFGFNDKELQRQFNAQLMKPEKLLKGPILEATPHFKTGMTLDGLIQEGVLSKYFYELNTNELPMDRSLYRHQEEAIRKVIEYGRNIIVSTGTGSGKTETFIIPILNYLMKELEKGTLSHGVRALLLYPMNALANDQLERLRTLLRNFPQITFGRYTGETREHNRNALTEYRKMYGTEPIPNELISREKMRESPPHILLTNYAMLEYLLLRPGDSIFFDGKHSRNWKFIVMDEIHTYSGARGIETAMLLRRLKDRIYKGSSGQVQCIGTSATLGRGRDDFKQIVQFATRLFGEPFAWMEGNISSQDVIEGHRIPMMQAMISWGEPDLDIYRRLNQTIKECPNNNCLESLIDISLDAGIPKKTVEHAQREAKKSGWKAFLYHVLRGDKRLLKLQRELQKGAQPLSEIAKEIIGEGEKNLKILVDLVELASLSKAHKKMPPLLPARYHTFVRAIEGAYIRLLPDTKVYIEKVETEKIAGEKYCIFESATCQQCKRLYLVGKREEENGIMYLRQSTQDMHNIQYFLIMSNISINNDFNEDDEVNFPEITKRSRKLTTYTLCAKCGAIERENYIGQTCNCKNTEYIKVIEVSTNQDGRACSCPACGRINPRGVIRRFLVGGDAAASVIGTVLYQEIKPKENKSIADNEEELLGDEWNPGPAIHKIENLKKQSRKLLIFSDSRQDAAFFAPFFNQTHDQILRRRLIIKTLKKYTEEIIMNQWRLQNMVDGIYSVAKENDIFKDISVQDGKNHVWKWLFFEFLAIRKRNSLEGLGLIQFRLVKPKYWRAPLPLKRAPWNLTDNEVWTLYQILLDSLRTKGVVVFPDWILPNDEFFQPRNREFYIRGENTAANRGILSWYSDRLNSRLDYIVRLAMNIDSNISEYECKNLLKNIWTNAIGLGKSSSIWDSHFNSNSLSGEGVVYQMQNDIWEVVSSLIHKDVNWYRCETCHNITPYNIKNTCTSYRCGGKLSICKPDEVFKDHHYYKLYMEPETIRMEAREHTAQLKSETAAELQNNFINGNINVLSCSTTFELGVDVGELETVFMRNMPPSAANYIQRAGRAGRRTDSVAFVLTFAQRRSHDLTHYHEPWRMVMGEIKAPYFTLDNEKIILRHIYATAISAFWRENTDYFGNVENFFFHPDLSGPEKLKNYLESKPRNILESLKSIVPKHLQNSPKIKLSKWGWIKFLQGSGLSVMDRAEQELVNDVEQIKKERNRLFQEGRSIGYLDRLLNTLKTKHVLNFMSSRNILPKYGFPVDVVQLQIDHHSREGKQLQLDRDLRIALSEYAPSSEIVAAGKLWTSRYIKPVPTKTWERYRYAICPVCKAFHRKRVVELAKFDNPFYKCEVCNSNIGNHVGDYIVPSFGFIASTNTPKDPGEIRPEKTYTTRVYYSGQGQDVEGTSLQLFDVNLYATPASHGKLVVINSGGGRGFKVCYNCGYTLLGGEKTEDKHKTNLSRDCFGKLYGNLSLGHEFETDIIKLYFDGYGDAREGFWLSILYALLEGACEALQIERQDLDGCLYPTAGDINRPALILFDDVPGGAGHVRRMGDKRILLDVLYTTLERLQRCECGGTDKDASCYGCLRHYHNQFCHDILNRGLVIRFLEHILNVDSDKLTHTEYSM
ncbi:MAG: DEAD/DEAH box helicase [Clostridiales bacterium]|nr:DEAD/DEAH box helicase [Clostridiales bacterium]